MKSVNQLNLNNSKGYVMSNKLNELVVMNCDSWYCDYCELEVVGGYVHLNDNKKPCCSKECKDNSKPVKENDSE